MYVGSVHPKKDATITIWQGGRFIREYIEGHQQPQKITPEHCFLCLPQLSAMENVLVFFFLTWKDIHASFIQYT